MYITLRTCLISILLFLTHLVTFGNEYFKVTVQKGETVSQLLVRYKLSTSSCNLDLFKAINNLKTIEMIKADMDYKLPLKIYKYDGKSIRTTIGNNNLDLAKRIESYNIDIWSSKIRQTHFKDSKLLWVPEEFVNCSDNAKNEIKAVNEEVKDETIKKVDSITENTKILNSKDPDAAESIFKNKGIKQITVPLMGKKYEKVWIEDFSLKNQVFYIISGHGGPDPGAVCTECPEQMCEDEYAYDVALRLARNLMQHGAIVHIIVQDENDGIRDEKYLICDKDETLMGKKEIPLNQKLRLRQRVEAVNSLYHRYKKQGINNQKAIEIHVDSRNKDKRQDVFFYYNKNSAKGKKLANDVQNIFQEKYDTHQKNRGYQGFIEDRSIYMVNNLLPTTLFVELANIRNPKDQERLIHYTNRQALANWLFEGLRKN